MSANDGTMEPIKRSTLGVSCERAPAQAPSSALHTIVNERHWGAADGRWSCSAPNEPGEAHRGSVCRKARASTRRHCNCWCEAACASHTGASSSPSSRRGPSRTCIWLANRSRAPRCGSSCGSTSVRPCARRSDHRIGADLDRPSTGHALGDARSPTSRCTAYLLPPIALRRARGTRRSARHRKYGQAAEALARHFGESLNTVWLNRRQGSTVAAETQA